MTAAPRRTIGGAWGGRAGDRHAHTDYGASKNFEVHHVDLAAGLYNLEKVANLDQLPATGSFLIAAPTRWKAGRADRAAFLLSFQRQGNSVERNARAS